MSKSSGLSKFIVGAGIGFGIGLLVAAKSGKETREDIKYKFNELEDKIKNLKYDDLKEGALEKLDELKIKINDLDQEKTRDIFKEKINDIKDKLSELSRYIRKKSSPAIKKIIGEISNKLDLLDNDN